MKTTVDKYFPVLRRFIAVDCVDKEVITEIIGFGLNSITDQESWASAVCEMSYGMVHQLSKAYGTLKLLSDSRVAVAIRAGLVEMCLNFVHNLECLMMVLLSWILLALFLK